MGSPCQVIICWPGTGTTVSGRNHFFRTPNSYQVDQLLYDDNFNLRRFFRFISNDFNTILLRVTKRRGSDITRTSFHRTIKTTKVNFYNLFMVYRELLLSLVRRVFRPFRLNLYNFPTRITTHGASENTRFRRPIVSANVNNIN